MMKLQLCLAVAVCCSSQLMADDAILPDGHHSATLTIPAVTAGDPVAGKRVAVTSPEYAGTEVFHTLYLPPDWTPDGPPLPIVFEYTGNHFPKAGSTGEVEGAGLGYGLSGGKFIWVSLPYISEDHRDNQITWWGDEKATVRYAKLNVPRIIKKYNADPNAVFLCGFSRGAIGVNYIGLHDDEIARLWTGFITHDHFDGVRQWGNTTWGSPLGKYREQAATRLRRVAERPYLVCQHGSGYGTDLFVVEVLSHRNNFRFLTVNTREALGAFPNEFAIHAHNDRWLNLPSQYRAIAWTWMKKAVVGHLRSMPVEQRGELVFEDRFERSESQEQKDEPGNGWTTSSEKTAGGNKQVDLRDGAMHIYTHTSANHATSVRHTFEFRDGTLTIRFKLRDANDSLKLNFVDSDCKEIHAGHLFNVVVGPGIVTLHDRKTGDMNLKIREAIKTKSLSDEQKANLATKQRSFPANITAGTWHEVAAHVDGDWLSVDIDGRPIGRYSSAGFGHPKKAMIRLLVPDTVTVDDLRIYKRR